MMAIMRIKPHRLAPGLLLLLAACAQPGGPQSTSGVEMGVGAPRGQVAVLPLLKNAKGLESFKGLSAAQVESALGAPSFRRRDPPAEIWQYRVKSCALDLFLYDEAWGQSVAHAAVRPAQGGAAISDRACLDEVLNRSEKPVS
jgi:hypothetical protein